MQEWSSIEPPLWFRLASFLCAVLIVSQIYGDAWSSRETHLCNFGKTSEGLALALFEEMVNTSVLHCNCMSSLVLREMFEANYDASV